MGNWDVSKSNKDVEPCEDAISRQAIRYLSYDISEIDGEHYKEPHYVVDFDDIEKLPSVQPISRWIPIKTRPMTEEEKEDLRETEWYDELYELEEVLDCPMPDDGQEVWITVYGRVERDVYHDDFHGCYFDDWEISDVTAWMPGPWAYRESEEQA